MFDIKLESTSSNMENLNVIARQISTQFIAMKWNECLKSKADMIAVLQDHCWKSMKEFEAFLEGKLLLDEPIEPELCILECKKFAHDASVLWLYCTELAYPDVPDICPPIFEEYRKRFENIYRGGTGYPKCLQDAGMLSSKEFGKMCNFLESSVIVLNE